MGMYTEIRTNLIVNDLDVVKILKWMLHHELESDPDFEVPSHQFFKCERWRNTLVGGSAYFDEYLTEFDEIYYGRFHLKTVSNIKNYDGEIGKFADWIRPYCEPQPRPIVTEEYEGTRESLNCYYQDGKVEFGVELSDPNDRYSFSVLTRPHTD